jgi:hypothetical protein
VLDCLTDPDEGLDFTGLGFGDHVDEFRPGWRASSAAGGTTRSFPALVEASEGEDRVQFDLVRPVYESLARIAVAIPVEAKVIGTDHAHRPCVIGAVATASRAVIVRRRRVKAGAL